MLIGKNNWYLARFYKSDEIFLRKHHLSRRLIESWRYFPYFKRVEEMHSILGRKVSLCRLTTLNSKVLQLQTKSKPDAGKFKGQQNFLFLWRKGHLEMAVLCIKKGLQQCILAPGYTNRRKITLRTYHIHIVKLEKRQKKSF